MTGLHQQGQEQTCVKTGDMAASWEMCMMSARGMLGIPCIAQGPKAGKWFL